MSYDDIVRIFIEPPETRIAAPALTSSPARRLRDALEPIATQGWWSRASAERIGALGLGFFDGYVWGRAAALGVPEPAVVAATFGVFEPALIADAFLRGRAAAGREEVLDARSVGAAQSLAAIVDGRRADEVSVPLLAALDALDGMGRPLFSALRALPLPDSAAGRLWRAAELVREHRGDGHLAAAVAAGLDNVSLSVLGELWVGYPAGEYNATRGLADETVRAALADLTSRGLVADGALTADGRAFREELESVTDLTQDDLVRRLGPEIETIIVAASSIADDVLAAKAFPHDPRKRALG